MVATRVFLYQNFSQRENVIIANLYVVIIILIPLIFSLSHTLKSQISSLKTDSEMTLENKSGHN